MVQWFGLDVPQSIAPQHPTTLTAGSPAQIKMVWFGTMVWFGLCRTT